VNGEPLDVGLLTASPGLVTLEVEGVRRSYRVHRAQGQTFVDGPAGPERPNAYVTSSARSPQV
ncbi:hypothetical protein, partial [Mycolicibacterium moriokaense]|uniref:hypothetical protein n=1 Tax=Mycolicibacterium moriokaense TaxID=39691 RepID=UPI001A9A19D7